MPLDRSKLLLRSDDVVAVDIGGEIAIADVQAGQYFGLDEIGSHIWDHLGQPLTFDELCLHLTDEFRGDSHTIEHDALNFISELMERNLIRFC